MNAREIIQASAKEAEAMSRERLAESMTERVAWAELRRIRRWIVETKRMLSQAHFASAWHVLEEQLADYCSERDSNMAKIRRAQYAMRRMM